MTKNYWNWSPRESVGCIKFGEKVCPHKWGLSLKKIKDETDDEPWSEFDMLDGTARISVEDDLVDSIEVVNNFIFKNNNLIGMNYLDALKLFEESFVQTNSWDGGGQQLTCEDLDIILWVEDDLVESVTVS